MKTEEIATFLAAKFKRESARLNSWGTKTDEKAAYSFAMAVLEHVRALMSDARHRELKRLVKKISHLGYKAHKPSYEATTKAQNYIHERMQATKSMAAAIQKFAEAKEEKRAWKSKERKHHHGHDKHKHKHHKRHG